MIVLNKLKKANKKAFRNNKRKQRDKKQKQPKGDKFKLLIRFSQFGSLTKYNVEQLYNKEGEKFLSDLIKEGYVEKGKKEIRINQENVSYFKLTTKGQKLVKSKGYTLYYSNSARHDIVHATNVISHFKDFLDYYKHEKELKECPYGTYSRVDGAIIHNNNTIYVETITRNYKQTHIDSKRGYVKAYGTRDKHSYIEFNEKSKRR